MIIMAEMVYGIQSFHQFGWDMGTISSTREISRGKGKAVAGRPAAGASLSLTHSKQLVLAGTVCLYATLPRERDCIP